MLCLSNLKIGEHFRFKKIMENRKLMESKKIELLIKKDKQLSNQKRMAWNKNFKRINTFL